MDITSYIESGIIEQVALGLASDQEMREVQCMMFIYPEIRAEYEAFSAALERNAFENAVAPDPAVKERLVQQISKDAGKKNKDAASTTPQEAKIVTMSAAPVPNFWKFATAAAVAGILVVATLWYTANTRSSELSVRMASIEDKLEASEQAMTAMSADQEKMAAVHEVLSDKMTVGMEMTGMPKSPDAAVKIMYNPGMKKAVMVAENIPQLPQDMIYQLWAIKDGKPISLGLFDNSELAEMTDPFAIPDGQISIYAITMEPRGGVVSPTLENMMVAGNVNS